MMKGKVCMITGTSSGIGKATAVGLASLGASIVAVMRKSEKSDSALREIKAKSQDSSVIAMDADLSSQQSIRELTNDFNGRFERLDVLINNAGVNCSKRTVTVDGLETTFAVNVIAPFLLTNLLLEKLKASAPSRIVNVSSEAANGSRIYWEDLQGEKKYSMFRAYGQSKLGLNLITLEFSRRLVRTSVTANFLHPGVVRTNLARDLNPVAQAIFSFVKLFFASPEKGAKTSIYLASSPEVEKVSGKYFAKEREATAPKQSYDEEAARRLWQKCEELTGLRQTETKMEGRML
jgi:NAD(P)-dependent dehydrogenase (short-subunit alcohol dehydrogenase family)